MTAIKIEHKIVAQAIAKKTDAANEPAPQKPEDLPVQMNEFIERPDFLIGSTYKIKPPVSENALYITINDIILNEDTDHEIRRPYEMFINSKEMDHFQWIVAQTRLISAIFRKGGDLTFMIEELKSVSDPNGGYYMKGGIFMHSLVAHIGTVIEKHLKKIGMIEDEEKTEAQKALIAEKRAAYEAQNAQADAVAESDDSDANYPASATVCKSCSVKAVILLDGCETCLACSSSKCG